MSYFIYAIVGLLAGGTAALGLGGGFILLLYISLFTDIPQQQAALLNLVFFVIIGIPAVILHTKHKLIEKKLLLPIISGGVVGAIIGGIISAAVDPRLLQKLFALLILFLGIKELYQATKAIKKGKASPKSKKGRGK